MARSRNGKNTGPGRLRSTAMKSATRRMKTSATRKSSTLTRNARRVSGNDSRNCLPLKKACFTASQPGEFTTAIPRAAKSTTVLATAIRTALRPSPCHAPPRIRDLRPAANCSTSPGGLGASGGLTPPITDAARPLLRLDHGVGDGLQPLLLEGGQRPVGVERLDGLVDALDQRVPLLQHQPELLLLPDGRELPHDHTVLGLTDQDVHVGRRRVDEVTVDLACIERGDDVRGVVVHGRLLVRFDVVHDVPVARGADLRS